MAGIDAATFYRWVKKHKDFCDAIKKAAAHAEGRLVATIGAAAIGKNWTAAMGCGSFRQGRGFASS